MTHSDMVEHLVVNRPGIAADMIMTYHHVYRSTLEPKNVDDRGKAAHRAASGTDSGRRFRPGHDDAWRTPRVDQEAGAQVG